MTPEEEVDAFAERADRRQTHTGVVLMVLGSLLALSDAAPPMDGRSLWAFLMIVAGGVMADRALTRARRRNERHTR